MLFLLLSASLQSAPFPLPFCDFGGNKSTLILSQGQSQFFDMDSFVKGYNINYTLKNAPDFVNMSSKIMINNTLYPSSQSLISVKYTFQGHFYALETDGKETYLQYETAQGIYAMKIEEDADQYCLDVEVIDYFHITYALIDCVSTDTQGRPVHNTMFFVDVLNHKKLDHIFVNAFYQPFKNVTAKRLHVHTNRETNIIILYRIFLKNGVDEAHENRTYVQILELSDLFSPRVVDLIDYTTLHDDYLAIEDYEFINDQLMLLNYQRGLYIITYETHSTITVKHKLAFKDNYHQFGVTPTHFLFATNYAVYAYRIIANQFILDTKIALPPESTVTHLLANENYLFISAYIPFLGASPQAIYVHCTWAFTINDRSYTQAQFQVDHISEATFQFLRGDRLVMFGSKGISTYTFLPPKLYIEAKTVGNSTFRIIANSTSFRDKFLQCPLDLTVIVQAEADESITQLRDIDDQKGFLEPPDNLYISLAGWFHGPFLNYTLEAQSGTTLPNYESAKNIRKKMNWLEGPKLTEIGMIDMLEEKATGANDGTRMIWAFVQLKNFSIYTLTCYETDFLTDVLCFTEAYRHDPISNISHISHTWIDLSTGTGLVIAAVFENDLDTVILFQAKSLMHARMLRFGTGYQNQVRQVTLHFDYLYVVFDIGKRVQIFDLSDCLNRGGDCPRVGLLNTRNVPLEYFSPRRVIKQYERDDEFFLQCDGHLLVFNTPNHEFQYRPFALHSYPLPRDCYIQISRHGAAIFQRNGAVTLVHAVPGTSRYYVQRRLNILNWTNGLTDTAGSTIYFVGVGNEVIALHPWFTGSAVNYVRFTLNSKIRAIENFDLDNREVLMVLTEAELELHLVYKLPYLAVRKVNESFVAKFRAVNARNSAGGPLLNYTALRDSHTKLIPVKNFTNKTETKGLFAITAKQPNVSVSDKDWFNGTLFGYHANCTDCGKDLHFRNHVQREHESEGLNLILDVHSTQDSHAYVQQLDVIARLHRNGSIQQYSIMPNQDFKICNKIAVPRNELYAVSVCDEFMVTLYITSFTSEKAFTWGPYRTDVTFAIKAEMEWDVLAIMEGFPNRLHLYTLDLYEDDDEQFNFLDTLDAMDFEVPGHTGQLELGSFDLDKVPGKNLYRLALTEMRTSTLIIVTFELVDNNNEINMLRVSYLSSKDIAPVEELPVLRFNQVAFLQRNVVINIEVYTVLLTVSNWHHIEFQIRMDRNNVATARLERLYERYPWRLENYLKHKDHDMNFFAVPYSSDGLQFVAVYDSYFDPQANISKTVRAAGREVELRQMMGAQMHHDNFMLSFDFNRSNVTGFDGLIVCDARTPNISSVSVNRNISVWVEGGKRVPSQVINLTAFNSVSNYTFQVDFSSDQSFEEQFFVAVLIVAAFIVAASGIVIVARIVGKRRREELMAASEIHQSLLPEEEAPAQVRQQQQAPQDGPSLQERQQQRELEEEMKIN